MSLSLAPNPSGAFLSGTKIYFKSNAAGNYRLVSTVTGMMFPDKKKPEAVYEWEAENFAWVDFFWSTLGRSGGAGDDVLNGWGGNDVIQGGGGHGHDEHFDGGGDA